MALEPGSAILSAIYNGRTDDAKRLADQAPALTIWEAAALGREEQLRQVLDREPGMLNAHAADGNTPLGLAAFFGQPAVVRLLLDRGADVSAVAQNYMRVQALHAAVAGRNAEAVGLLLDRGADPNARQQVGYTPLMGAAAAGRDDMVDLLLRHGADPALLTEDGKTAASLAREHDHHALADRLAQAMPR